MGKNGNRRKKTKNKHNGTIIINKYKTNDNNNKQNMNKIMKRVKRNLKGIRITIQIYTKFEK